MAITDSTSAPLADYFWIAGVDSISYTESYATAQQPRDSFAATTNGNGVNHGTAPIEETIAEASELDDDHSDPVFSSTSSTAAKHSRTNSWQRLSKLSQDARSSIQSLDTLNDSTSIRSSSTIRAIPQDGIPKGANGTNGTHDNAGTNGSMDDFDFDRILTKFASERENFLDDLSFSAGTVQQKQPPMTSKPERSKNGVGPDAHSPSLHSSPFSKHGGTLRRKISFKDMSSLQRRPTVNRSNSVRTSKRMSNYNSVIPPPEPLNSDPEMHPLKRRFEPVLLDRYPPKTATEELKRRGRFPDYVPMFAFPNDINIVSADERPRSTWHGFAMTADDNEKIYGITVVVWSPLNQDAAAGVERKCEEWRQSHMTNEERELAASLAERLAFERAKLSRLLAQLPTVTSGSAARDALEEHISLVEEKITLMTDMLRPVRHGAAAKIEGLTDGETGLWTPRAFGVLGRDGTMTSFWKEWLRAVVVPMTDGGVLRVPPSSPVVGRWQPLERYVINLCTEALSPISSKTQIELAVRELRLFARKEALNELPDSRNADLYALFRSMSLHNIIALFEFALSESRIIFVSSHTAMLHLVSKALISLLYPLKWQSIFIPVLPARLLSALEAPCPYIVGIERRYENVEFPEDDCVVVDLDNDTIESTAPPITLPRQQRRKLYSLLQLAAPHHNKCGVPVGPPPYAIESFPYDAFSSETPAIFSQNSAPSTLSKYVSENSALFGEADQISPPRIPVFNAFLQSKNNHERIDRPSTSKSNRIPSPPNSLSPTSSNLPSFPMAPPTPTTGSSISRNDSGYALTSTLKEKRSMGHFDQHSRRSASFGGPDRAQALRRPSNQFQGHQSSLSVSSAAIDTRSVYGYAPSTYAASTLAASTIMPNMLVQPVHNTDSTIWVEGHCMEVQKHDLTSVCSICDERADADGTYKCTGCSVSVHSRCLGHVSLVCPRAFYADRVRAAFVRCFASLFYTYRKYLKGPNREQKKAGHLFGFDMEAFVRSQPQENAEYLAMLRQTQAFNEFIALRETTPSTSPETRLFDEIILAKKNRGFSRASFFARSATTFLDDKSEHLWRSASVPSPTGQFKGEYKSVICRIPAKLDPALMKEPRVVLGQPRVEMGGGEGRRRKAVPSMLGLPGAGKGI